MNAGANGYRIPLPQEWTLANTTDANSATDAYNWLIGNSGGKTQPVGTKLPNPVGLYDMEGNVLELTWGNPKKNIDNAPWRMGSHFARVSQIGKSPQLTSEFAGVGRAQVGFRVMRNLPWQLLASAGSHGTISPDSINVADGATGTFTVSSDPYWQIDAVRTNGIDAGLSPAPGADNLGYVWSNVTADGVLSADISAMVATNSTPLWWLAGYGLTPGDAGALSDTDTDGQAAWEEYIAGTLPNLGTSFFGISSAWNSPSGMVLAWPAVSGRLYSVYWSPDLVSGAWSQLSGDAVGSYTDAVHAVENKGFYRVKVQLNP
jgi:hypothetical protein